MRTVRPSVICDRVRSQISLELDGELSQLERAMVVAHVERCHECRTYQGEVTSFTNALREAPLERLTAPVVFRRPRRVVAARLQAGVAAAAVAIVSLGVATQIASEPQGQTGSPSPRQQLQFPSQQDLDREQAILEKVRAGRSILLDGLVL